LTFETVWWSDCCAGTVPSEFVYSCAAAGAVVWCVCQPGDVALWNTFSVHDGPAGVIAVGTGGAGRGRGGGVLFVVVCVCDLRLVAWLAGEQVKWAGRDWTGRDGTGRVDSPPGGCRAFSACCPACEQSRVDDVCQVDETGRDGTEHRNAAGQDGCTASHPPTPLSSRRCRISGRGGSTGEKLISCENFVCITMITLRAFQRYHFRRSTARSRAIFCNFIIEKKPNHIIFGQLSTILINYKLYYKTVIFLHFSTLTAPRRWLRPSTRCFRRLLYRAGPWHGQERAFARLCRLT
jgi:hypothetical protein